VGKGLGARLSRLADNAGAMLRLALERTVKFGRGQITFTLLTATLGVLVLWYLNDQRGGLLIPVIALAAGIGGALGLNFLWNLAWSYRRLKRGAYSYRGTVMAQGKGRFRRWTSGGRTTAASVLHTTCDRRGPEGEIVCEFFYPRPPWVASISMMYWFGQARRRFRVEEGTALIEVSYPGGFAPASPASDFPAPGLAAGLDMPYSVFWRDASSGEYLVRYQLAVEERA